MKVTAVLCFMLLFFSGPFSPASADPVITPPEAAKYPGKWVTVCGKVEGVQYLRPRMGEPTYIYFEGPGPVLAAVVMGLDRAKFGVPLEVLYDGKTVCVSGIVTKSRNRYLINVREPSQVQVSQ